MQKKNIYIKNMATIAIFLIVIIIFTTSIYAITPNDYKPISGGDTTKITTKANAILGIIQVVGSIISVIALVVIGIKYMAGSIEEKAEYKKTMLPYLIGSVLLFAASQLVSVIYNFAQGF